MDSAPEITPLTLAPDTVAALAAILIEVVANGGSVSFMHPLSPADAEAFWTRSLGAADEGRRIVLGARLARELVGTLMTGLAHRGRGVARALMIEAERLAVANGRTLLTLDTAEEDGAAGLYEGLGYQYVGTIPDYALKPLGGLTGTRIYFKRIGGDG
jgi:GNAT superfamily N-acetyltransferase